MRKALIFLGILNETDIDWIVRNGTKERVARGTVLIQESKQMDSVFFILDGEFRISTGSENVEITCLKCGEILGEMSFVDSRPPSATVTATMDSLVGVVDRRKLQERLKTDVRFAARFYRAIAVLLSNRLRTTVANLGYGKELESDEDVENRDEIAPHLLEKVALAGTRFNEMQSRSWGG